jgi:flap endonuclease-1
MLDILNIEYVEAPQAGETQAAYMTQETPAVYGCASDDYDSLLFGANYTIRNLSSPDDLEMISLDKTLSNLELTRAELVDVAILCGTDYNDGVYGYGPKTSVTTVQNNEAETVFKENNVNYKKLRELFLNPKTTEINTVQNTLPNPNISELETYLYSLDFSEDTIGASLERIRSNTEQPELSKWT